MSSSNRESLNIGRESLGRILSSQASGRASIAIGLPLASLRRLGDGSPSKRRASSGTPLRNRHSKEVISSPDVRDAVSRVLASAESSPTPVNTGQSKDELYDALMQKDADLRQAAEVGAAMVRQNAELVEIIEDLEAQLAGIENNEEGNRDENGLASRRESSADAITALYRDLEMTREDLESEERRREAAVLKMDDLAKVNVELQEALRSQSEAVESGNKSLIEKLRHAESVIQEQQAQIRHHSETVRELATARSKLKVNADLLSASEARADALESQLSEAHAASSRSEDAQPADPTVSDPSEPPRRAVDAVQDRERAMSVIPPTAGEIQLTQENASLSAKLTVVTKDLNELRVLHSELKDRYATLTTAQPSSHAGGSAGQGSLAAELDAARNDAEGSHRSSASGNGEGLVESERNKLLSVIEALEADLAAERSKDGHLGAQLAKSEASLHTLQTEHADVVKAHEGCATELTQAKATVKQLSERLRDVEAKFEASDTGALREQLRTAEERIESLKIVLESAVPKYDIERERSAEEMDKLRDSLREEIAQLKRELAAIQQELAAAKLAEAQAVAQAKEQVKVAERALKERDVAFEARDSVAADAEERVKHMRDILEQGLEQQGVVKEEALQRREAIEKLEDQLKTQASAAERHLAQATSILRTQLAEVSGERDAVQEELSQLKTSHDAGEARVAELVKAKAEKEEEIASLRAEVTALEKAAVESAASHRSALASQASDAQKERENDSTTIRNLREALTTAEGGLDRARESETKTADDLNLMMTQMSELEEMISQSTTREADLESSVADAQERTNELEGQLSDAQDRVRDLERLQNQTGDDTAKEISRLKGQLSDAQSRIHDLEQIKDQSNDDAKEIAKLKRELERAQKETSRVSKEEKERTAKLQARLTALEEEGRNQKKKTEAKYKSQVEELESTIQTLREQISDKEQSISDLNTTLEEVQDEQGRDVESLDEERARALEALEKAEASLAAKSKELGIIRKREVSLLRSNQWKSTLLIIIASIIVLIIAGVVMQSEYFGPLPT